MHLPIPCSSTVELPSLLGFPPKFYSTSTSTSTCSFFLLSFVGIAVLLVITSLRFVLWKKSKSRTLEREKEQKSEKGPVQVQSRSWRSFLGGLDSVNLPVTLTASSSSTVVGRGVGLNGAVLGKQVPMSQPVRSGPTFEQPLPAIYQSKEPLSMAKMIMSRHTFRRPNQSQRISVPRRSTSLPPASSSRPQSMV
ncbi:hypothetical protein GYMLUDRAFT_68086 [Collybiopsis luxurians FD-317 M1]|nr:hypothetical protein GYMLUDRAFT_68086 [Collybiopsis luxurians FD-317 M1]